MPKRRLLLTLPADPTVGGCGGNGRHPSSALPDFARKALKATAAPTTPMLHFNDGWVSSQVRGLLGTACSLNSPSARSCPSIGAKSPSGSAVDFGSSVI